MRVLRNTAVGIEAEISWDELTMINNALNEVGNGVAIEEPEFKTRIGFHRDYVRALLERVRDALNSN